MINKKYNFLLGILFISISSFLTSCDEVEDAEIGGVTLQEMTGDWWVVALNPDGETPAYGGDYVHFSTYNTSSNDTGLWLDDHDEWMQLKSKVTADGQNLTFSGEAGAEELYADATVTVSNGSISKETFTTESNTMVDEITFEAEFDWDPGIVYIFKGHRRTGFAEDENPHYSN